MAKTELTFEDRAKGAKGAAALNSFADYLATEGKGLVTALKPALTLYTKDDAEHVYRTAHALAAKKRGKVLTEPAASRVSACAGLWKAQEWKAWPQFLANLEKVDPAWDTLINLCNWFRSQKGDDALKLDKATSVAPTVADIEARLGKAKAARTARDKAKKLEGVDAVKVAPGSALLASIETLGHLVALETDSKAKAFLEAAVRSLDSYKPFVAKLEEEAAVEAARKATREKYGAGK